MACVALPTCSLGRCVIVVGGAATSEAKVSLLLDAGASVTVVSPTLTPGLAERRDAGLLTWIGRRFRREALHGAFVVVAATDRSDVNGEV